MFFSSLTLENFRNHAFTEISPAADINLIIGENAQGKTNLLEAIYCLSRGNGFRSRKESELIRFGYADTALKGTLQGKNRDYQLLLRLGAHRGAFINEVRKKHIGEFTNLFHVILFAPDDLNLLKGPAANRRFLLDSTLCQLRPHYSELLSEYNRLHAHIRTILKEGDPHGVLDDFMYQLCVTGAQIIPYRAAFCKALAIQSAVYHAEIAGGEKLDAVYKTVSSVTDPEGLPKNIGRELWKHYEEHREASMKTGSLLTGPHRDDILFSIGNDGLPAKTFASQGQVRTAAIAVKLAQREIFRRADGESPVLLLDDVLSELDASRRSYILRGITGGQVFITSCDPDALQEKACRVFAVKNGVVSERNQQSCISI